MVRHVLVTLLFTSLTSAAIVPTASIYRAPWLNLRRARDARGSGTLNNQNQHAVPRPLSPRDPTAVHSFSSGRSFSTSGSTSGYIVAPTSAYPAYDIAMAPAHRLIYASISPSRSYFALPTFTKRVDKAPEPTPCSLLASAGYQPQQIASTSASASSQSSETFDSSHLHPIYVLPPKNFQPIIYHPNSIYPPLPVQILQPVSANRKGGVTEENWFVKGEARTPEAGAENENEIDSSRRKVLLIAVSDNTFHPFPIYEASIRTAVEKSKPEKVFGAESTLPGAVNPYNSINKVDDTKSEKKDSRRLKTKLPVGMTSFFLGGVRGVSGRHWQMPSEIVRQMEFMPNGSPISPESKYLPEDGYVTKQIDESPLPAPGPGVPIPGADPSQPGYVTEIEEEEAKSTLAGGNADKGSDNDIRDRTDIEAAESNHGSTSVRVPRPGVKGIEEQSTFSLTH